MNYSPQQPNVAPQQPQGYAQAAAPQANVPPQPNTASFTADVKTIEILNTVHPELVSALINIAIKKFAENSDFADYFVKDEYKQIMESAIKEQSAQKEQSALKEQSQPTSAPAVDFAQW